VHRGFDAVTGLATADAHGEAFGQHTEQRHVPGQDAELTVERARDDERGLACPDLALGRNQLDGKRHY